MGECITALRRFLNLISILGICGLKRDPLLGVGLISFVLKGVGRYGSIFLDWFEWIMGKMGYDSISRPLTGNVFQGGGYFFHLWCTFCLFRFRFYASIVLLRYWVIFLSAAAVMSLYRPPYTAGGVSSVSGPCFLPVPPRFRRRMVACPPFFAVQTVSYFYLLRWLT